MNSKTIIIAVLIIYGVITFGLSLKAALAKKAEVEEITPKVSIYTLSTFESNATTVNQIKTFRQFGALPVTVDPASLGKDNPFVP